MTQAWRVVRRVLLGIAIFFIAGCSALTEASNPNDSTRLLWQGRLRVHVAGATPHNFTAAFALEGNAQAGSLSLYTPLGTTAARVVWEPEGARLQASGQTQSFASLADLTRQLTGADLPVASLFAWLQGIDQPTTGWKADLGELPEGRLRAQRLDPDAPAELLIVLER